MELKKNLISCLIFPIAPVAVIFLTSALCREIWTENFYTPGEDGGEVEPTLALFIIPLLLVIAAFLFAGLTALTRWVARRFEPVVDGDSARRPGSHCVVSVSAFDRFPDGRCARSLQILAGGLRMGSQRGDRRGICGSATFTSKGIILRPRTGFCRAIFRIPYRLCIIDLGPMLPAARSRWER